MSCPIIYYKLSKKGKELFNEIEKFKNINIRKIELYSDEYNLLLDAIPFHKRNDYLENIPLGKLLVFRRK